MQMYKYGSLRHVSTQRHDAEKRDPPTFLEAHLHLKGFEGLLHTVIKNVLSSLGPQGRFITCECTVHVMQTKHSGCSRSIKQSFVAGALNKAWNSAQGWTRTAEF